MLTFDASVLNTGSHSQQHFCQLIVASRAGQREKALSIFGGVLKPVVTWLKGWGGEGQYQATP